MNPQPYSAGSTYQISSTTGLRNVERYEVLVDETRTNTVAFADSSYLVCPLQQGEMIFWMAMLNFGYGTSPGQAKVQFVTPAGLASGGLFYLAYLPGAPPPALFGGGVGLYNANLTALEDNTGAGNEFPNYFWGRFVNGTNSGQFSVQWAQNAANATATTLTRGSYLEVWRR